jgi:hypothetical protein
MEQPPDTPQPPVPAQPLRRARRLAELPTRRITAFHVTVIGVIILAVLGILILPPIQVPARLSWLGCTEISVKSPSADGPDGLNISLANGSSAPLRFKLSRIEQDKLSVAALKAIPEQWTPAGPMYQTQACGANKSPVVLSVPVSSDATMADQLDLVSWNGKNWQWVSSHADIAYGTLVAQLDALPPNVMVMQTAPLPPVISAELPAEVMPSERALADINEFAVPAFLISNDGTLQGDSTELPPPVDSSHEMFAVTRNWAPNAAVNVGMVEEVLADDKLRAEHVKALTDAVSRANYAGVVVDYRGLTTDSRKSFTRFVSELAAALHRNRQQLVVNVPAPVQFGDEWDTAGYDWRTIGTVADVVQVDAPDDPAAFTASRRAERMLGWAVGEVSRQKLQIAFSTSSVKETGGALQLIPYEESLKPFKTITSPVAAGDVSPGAQVTLALGDTPGVELDEASRHYHYTLTNTDGTTSTVWINTGAALAQKLDLASHFNLRGVTVKGLFASAQEPGVWVALEQYLAQAVTAVPAQLRVVWTVRNSAGTQLTGGTTTLTDTTFVWTAPAELDHYTIAAALPGSATRGELAINVAQPTPTPTPIPTSTPPPEAITTLSPGTTAKCPDAKFVADVTVPDNSQFDKNKTFVKTWKIRNVGSCDWPAGTLAVYASGDKMSAPENVQVGAVKVGDAVDISVNLTSPDKDGNFQATWRLMDDKGTLFGEQMTVVIVAGQPQAVAAAAPDTNLPASASAPPPVAAGTSGGFELGGQVNSFAFPDKMHYAGMNWVKHQTRWGPGDSPAGEAGRIADAHNKGFKVLLSVLGSPAASNPANFPAYATFVGELAKLGPDAIEVWNEENIDREWQNGAINPTTYTDLLKQAYVAIKNANPNVVVVSGAPAPTGFFGGCAAAGCDDAPFLAGMAAAGAAAYMDCIGIHYNEGIISPNQTSGDPRSEHYTRYFWGMVNTYYNAFGGARKLCFTEMGYLTPEGYGSLPGGFAWAQNTTVGQQAQWLAEAASLSANSGKVRLIIVFNVDFNYWGEDPQAGYAIIRPGNSCPACDSLHAVLGTR